MPIVGRRALGHSASSLVPMSSIPQEVSVMKMSGPLVGSLEEDKQSRVRLSLVMALAVLNQSGKGLERTEPKKRLSIKNLLGN